MPRLDRSNSYDTPKETYPEVSDELIEFLEKAYPLDAFMRLSNMSDFDTYRGHRMVVEYLKAINQTNKEDSLKNIVSVRS